jgi:hypothetical protein
MNQKYGERVYHILRLFTCIHCTIKYSVFLNTPKYTPILWRLPLILRSSYTIFYFIWYHFFLPDDPDHVPRTWFRRIYFILPGASDRAPYRIHIPPRFESYPAGVAPQ